MSKRKIMVFVGTLTILFLALFYPGETAGEKDDTRIVRFPADRSIGLVYLVDRELRIDPTCTAFSNAAIRRLKDEDPDLRRLELNP